MRDAVERQQVVHAQRVERDRARDDQLVVAVLVGERRRRERLRRQQLGVGVGHPARRVPQPRGVEVGAERAEQVRRRALDGVAVDPALLVSVDTPVRGEPKLVEAVIVPGHVMFASAPGNFLRPLLRGNEQRARYCRTMSEENLEVVRQVYEAAARRDTATILTLYDPDVELDASALGVEGPTATSSAGTRASEASSASGTSRGERSSTATRSWSTPATR